MQKVLSAYSPKSQPWDSMRVLPEKFHREHMGITLKQAESLHELFWNDLCSELDAENFSKFLETSGICFSPEFMAMREAWRHDEWNHYLGFRRLYTALYEQDERHVVRRLIGRPVDFSPIAKFLSDEFSILLVMAYDEIATTRSYHEDYALYRGFGERFLEWIRLVTRDEAFHLHNCLDIIRLKYPERISEVSDVMWRLVAWDTGGGIYRGTFVLDHEGPYFTKEFLRTCVERICAYLHVPSLSLR